MRNYEGMRLPPTTDPHTRNELLKVDKYLKQMNGIWKNLVGPGNHPLPGGGTNFVPGSPPTSPLMDHDHSRTGLGGDILGTDGGLIRARGTWWHNYRIGINTDTPDASLHVTDAPVVSYINPQSIAAGGSWHDGALGPVLIDYLNTGPVLITLTFAQSGGADNFDLVIAGVPTPAAGTRVQIKFHARSVGANTGISAFLREGGATRATASTTASAVTGTFATFSYTMTAAEVAAVTNWSNLQFRFSRAAGINVQISEAWLEFSDSHTAVLFDESAGQVDPLFRCRNINHRNLLSLTNSTLNLGNDIDLVPAVITFGQNNDDFTGPPYAHLNWGFNAGILSDPNTTADQVGVVGARLYFLKDSDGTHDNAYGVSGTENWVLVSDSSRTYAVYTGRHGVGVPVKRVEWSGVGDQINYGRIAIRKNSIAGASTPELRLEETGTGTNYTALRAAAAITSDHIYVLPAALANGLFNNLVAGSTGTLSMLTAVRGDMLRGSAVPGWERVPVGAVGTVPTSDGTDWAWAAPSGGGVTDHGALTGLGDDDHPQYALLDGRPGGQVLFGSPDPAEGLDLRSTSDAAAGEVTVLHSEFRILDETDPTKKLGLDVTGITTGVTRIWSVQNEDGTVPILEVEQEWSAENTWDAPHVMEGIVHEQDTPVPARPSAGFIKFLAESGVGRANPAFYRETGKLQWIQGNMGQVGVHLVGPGTGPVGTTHGTTMQPVVGSGTTPTLANTSFLTSTRHLSVISAPGPTTYASYMQTALACWIGNAADRGGFYVCARARIGAASASLGHFGFMGLRNTTTAMGALEPGGGTGAVQNVAGLGVDPGDTNYHLFYNDNAGAPSKVDTGIAGGSPVQFEIYIEPNGTTMYFRVATIDDPSIAPFMHSDNTNLPQNSVFLAWHFHAATNADATQAVSLQFYRLYMETEN